MRKRKKNTRNPVEADLPQNPEFQEFVKNVRQIVSVPKAEIDRLWAEEQAERERKRMESQED